MKPVVKYSWAILLFTFACGNKQQTIHPIKKNLTEAVYASGNLYPFNEYKVSANADGFLVKRLVNPGDTVSIGTELFQIDNDLQNERLEAIERIYNKAKENYSDNSPVLQENLGAQRAALDKMKYDSVNFIRFKNLYETNSTSKSQYDNAALAYQLSLNDYKSKKQTYARLRNQLFVELQNAENNYNTARKDVANTIVISNIKGMVYDVLKEQSEAVRRNEILAVIGDADRLYLKLMVDELDIEKVKPGLDVYVELDIAPGRTYKATVNKIYPRLNREDQSFRVDAVFEGEIPQALYGVTVEANIIIHQKKQVLTLPKAAVSGGDSVWVLRNGKNEKIAFVKGVESFDEVEIVSGITENDEIILGLK